jgi:hypothetical protein
MATTAAAPEKIVVYSTITQQTADVPADSGKPLPWWHGLTLDQQDEMLDRIDPQQYAWGRALPMAVGRWNREKKRVRREREKWILEIRKLRRKCRCDNCRRHRRPPFPKYYVASNISYECWLEGQNVDPEMEELLTPLRNDREHVGAAIIGRSWNIPAV